MQGIRNWAFGICAAAVACGMTQMILPKSGMQKIFSVTASVFFLSCLLSPLMLAPISLSIESPERLQTEIQHRAKRLEEQLQLQQSEMAGESIRLKAAEILSDMGITFQKIYINTHADEENCISISECEVQLDESYLPRHDEIRQALMAQLGVNVRIGYQKE